MWQKGKNSNGQTLLIKMTANHSDTWNDTKKMQNDGCPPIQFVHRISFFTYHAIPPRSGARFLTFEPFNNSIRLTLFLCRQNSIGEGVEGIGCPPLYMAQIESEKF